MEDVLYPGDRVSSIVGASPRSRVRSGQGRRGPAAGPGVHSGPAARPEEEAAGMPASTDVDQATVVHIAVSRDDGKYGIAVFPQRVNDITLFFTRKGETPCAEKPREGVWIAHGIAKGQKIKIKAKRRGTR